MYVISGADPGFGNGGGGGRSRFLAKRVTYTSEAIIHQLGVREGRFEPPGKKKNLEPLRVNLSVIWQIISYFFCYFFIKNILENIFYDYRSNLFQIFEDNNETINNICKSNTQKVNN